MNGLSRLKLRDNWPVWLGGISVLLAIFAYTKTPFSNNIYNPNPDETINYSSLLISYTDSIALGLLVIFVLFAVLIVAMLVFRPRKRMFLALSLIVVAILGVSHICGSLFQDGTTLTAIGNTVYKDHRYELALNNTVAGGADVYIVSFMVFECDLDGLACHFLKEFEESIFSSNSEREAVFVVDPADDMLYVNVSDKFKSSVTCITCADS